MSIKSAFHAMVELQGKNRRMKLYALPKPAGVLGTLPVAPSNYQRTPAGPEATVGLGREFVVIADQAIELLGRAPKRTDRLEDPVLGIMTIESVKELVDIGGAVIGFRIWIEQ